LLPDVQVEVAEIIFGMLLTFLVDDVKTGDAGDVGVIEYVEVFAALFFAKRGLDV
jgi:hypothetical protein